VTFQHLNSRSQKKRSTTHYVAPRAHLALVHILGDLRLHDSSQVLRDLWASQRAEVAASAQGSSVQVWKAVHLLSLLSAPMVSGEHFQMRLHVWYYMFCLWYAFVVIRSMAVRETTKSFLWVFFAPVRVWERGWEFLPRIRSHLFVLVRLRAHTQRSLRLHSWRTFDLWAGDFSQGNVTKLRNDLLKRQVMCVGWGLWDSSCKLIKCVFLMFAM
jgi:hypothetical protein